MLALACLLAAPSPYAQARPARAGGPASPPPAHPRPLGDAGPAPPSADFDPDAGDQPPPAPPQPGMVVAVRGPGAAVWLRSWDGGRWSDWTSLGGQAAGAPTLATGGPGRLDVFAPGFDAGIWHRRWDGEWHPWEWLGGALAPGAAVAAASVSPGSLDLFARGADNGLWHRRLTDGGWQAWEPLGCCLGSDPAAASAAPGQLEVFARRSGGGIWERRLVGDSWGAWEFDGEPFAGRPQPSVVSWGGGRLDLFVRDGGGELWHRWREAGSGWEAWEPLGCCFGDAPAAASWGPGQLDLLVRGAAGGLLRRRFAGAWSAWETVDGEPSSSPAATAWTGASLVISTVPYRSQDHALSCEAAALQMALAREGIDVSQDDLLADIGIDWQPARFDESGELRWGDPYASFVGDPDGDEGALTGYGTYYPTIARAAAAHGADVLRAGEGIAADDVFQAVLQNHPVVAWVSVDRQPHPSGSWRTFGGRLVQYQGPVEHALTVVGVDRDSVYVFDPLLGPDWMSKDEFESAYSTYNHMAVILA